MNRSLWISMMLMACPMLTAGTPSAEAPVTAPTAARAPEKPVTTPSETKAPEAKAPEKPVAKPVAVAQAATNPLQSAPKEVQAFMNRVLAKLPQGGAAVPKYQFNNWSVPNAPTDEAVGLLPVAGVQPEKLIARVMDVDHYVGNIGHVDASHSVANPAFKPPQQVEFYQRVDIPVVGKIQQELVLVDAGTIKGYRVAYWYLLKDKTNKLDPAKGGARSDMSIGAWLAAPGVVGYALSSWPKRDDVGWLTWKALTTGADLTAKSVIEDNIKGMSAWSKK